MIDQKDRHLVKSCVSSVICLCVLFDFNLLSLTFTMNM